MPTQVQFRRGNTAQHSTFTGANGEITINTDTYSVVAHDGVTPGGFPTISSLNTQLTGNATAANLSVSGSLSFSRVKNSIIPDANNTYSLGNSTFRFSDLYLSGSTLYVGNAVISSNASGGITFANSTGGSSTVEIQSANATVKGIMFVVNSTSNTGTDVAAAAASVKTAFDAAGNAYSNATSYADNKAANAYSNAVSYADNKAANAYSNAIAYAANATNISSGTLDTARLPATANITTQLWVGANVALSTSALRVGNSTVNTVIDSSSISTGSLSGNGTNITSVDAATVGGNTASTLRTYTDDRAANAYSNAASYADNKAANAYSNAVSYADNKAANAYSNAIAYAANATNISSGTLDTARLPATISVATEVGVGSNVKMTVSTISLGNSTVNAYINASTLFIGNSTANSTLTGGNLALQGSTLTVGNVTITGSSIAVGNSTVNTFANSTVLNANQSAVYVDTLTVYGNLSVLGTTTTISSNNIVTNDPMIILGANNGGDLVDIGIIGHYANATGNSHAGIIRDATTKKWYVFGNYDQEPETSSDIDITRPGFVLANLVSNFVEASVVGATANMSTSVNSALITVGSDFTANTTGAYHTKLVNANNVSANSTVTVGSVVQKYATVTTSSTAQTTLDSFAAATYRSAKYIIQMTSGSAYHTLEVSVIHDGTTVYLVQYAENKSGASLGTIDASIATGTLSIQLTPTNAVTVAKAFATLIAV